ncbi:MAG: type IV secretion protein IcmD [Gammaproteobacteria bacterium]|nr:type IV secretion protein IcmD [Gammaproteobacteria bacterium]MCH9744091.1 type IV secretion protein IcmD [Gammaproteobacteria bacterium]
MKMKKRVFKSVVKSLAIMTGIAGALFAGSAFAADAPSLTSIASNIDKSVSSLATVLTDISLIAGIGFIMASFFKFHQHKLNPTQTPMSQGLTLLLIGAGLTLFPTILPTASHAVFGSDVSIAKVGGSGISSLIGS